MKYRLELVDGTTLWSEDVSDLCYYLKTLGLIDIRAATFIIKEFAYYGAIRCADDKFTIIEETEADE